MAFKTIRHPDTGRPIARYDPDTDRLEVKSRDLTGGRRQRFELAPLRRVDDSPPPGIDSTRKP